MPRRWITAALVVSLVGTLHSSRSWARPRWRGPASLRESPCWWRKSTSSVQRHHPRYKVVLAAALLASTVSAQTLLTAPAWVTGSSPCWTVAPSAQCPHIPLLWRWTGCHNNRCPISTNNRHPGTYLPGWLALQARPRFTTSLRRGSSEEWKTPVIITPTLTTTTQLGKFEHCYIWFIAFLLVRFFVSVLFSFFTSISPFWQSSPFYYQHHDSILYNWEDKETLKGMLLFFITKFIIIIVVICSII